MRLDLATVSTITAIVESLAGAVFLVQTLLHRRSRAARVWALAFFAGILTTICYFAWVIAPQAWIGNAIGNASFAVGIGCFWIGTVRYNRGRIAAPVAIVGAAAAIALVTALFDVQDPWAGAPVLFAEIALLAAAGAIETRRGTMRSRRYAIGLTAVLTLTSAYCIARFVVFLAAGPQSEAFGVWLGSESTGIVAIALSLVAVTTTSVLVAEEDAAAASSSAERGDGFAVVLDAAALELATTGMAQRAQRAGTSIAVLALSIPALPRIRDAFGSVEADALDRRFRDSVLARLDPTVPVGEAGPGRLLAVLPGRSLAQAEQAARSAHRLVTQDLAGASRAVVPLVGAGLAIGDSAPGLIAAACAAADRSAEEEGDLVVADDAALS